MENKVTTVHDAVSESRFAPEPTPTEDNVVFSFRIPQSIKEKAEHICKANSGHLGAFLRECCVGLVKDYVSPQAE